MFVNVNNLLNWGEVFDQFRYVCLYRVTDEQGEDRGSLGATLPRLEEVQARRDEAGPSAVGARSSRPRKLQARRPRAPSPVRAETSGSDEDGLGLGEVPVYPPPKRARIASKLAELGQVRINHVRMAFTKVICLQSY